MPNVKTLQRSFGAGEVSPHMYGRIDDGKYQTGLARCRNFRTKPQGPAENRAGFAYVGAAKNSAKHSRLIPFTYSTTQTMVIELAEGAIRFFTQGAPLLTGAVTAWSAVTAYAVADLASSGGINYYCIAAHTNHVPPNVTYWYPLTGTTVEVPSPYLEADLFDIHYVQSGDVLTLVHPNYAPRELRRLGAANWTLTTINFAASIAAPVAGGVTATPLTTADYSYSYVVTAVASDGITESAQNATGTVSNNLFTTGGKNTIAWSASAGASFYNVYKSVGGVFGYIGKTTALSFIDDNISPDMSKVPPVWDTVFNATNKYPGAVSYFEQRRLFAGTNTDPQTLWGTRSGTESAMNYSLPTIDDDRIKFRVAAREANTIRHIVPLSQLLLLTSGAEWRVTSVNSDAITPNSISVRPQSYVGASNVQPVIINNTLIYGAARGGHARELAYSWQSNGFVTGDLSLRAAHLFDGLDLVDMAYMKAPEPVVWFVSSNGVLLGLTYVPEQQIGAWHWHDTDGQFESCAVVAEGAEDYLYVVVRRDINGLSVRYIERMASRRYASLAQAFVVDCGGTVTGTNLTNVSGAAWLEGKTVSILADGAVVPQQVVTGGAFTLPNGITASTITFGLPITADLYTLPLAAEVDSAFGQGRQKNPNKVWLRVFESSGIFAGPDEDHLVEAKQRTTESPGSPPALKDGEVQITLKGGWTDGGQVLIRQSDPLPLTIVSMTVETALGG